MSQLCAKPTCSEAATRWFDIFASQRLVIERGEHTPSSISLCSQHGDRFSVPLGWRVEQELREPESPRQRQHDRNAPWFLAGSRNAERSDLVAPLLSESVDGDEELIDEPSAGSLLHRAFHGPDRSDDVARAKRAERDTAAPRAGTEAPAAEVTNTDESLPLVDDLTTRRAQQEEANGYDVELPFPPSEPARHLAV